MAEISALLTSILSSYGFVALMISALLIFVLLASGWLLWKIEPTLNRISENNLMIAKAQESTAINLKVTADLLQGLAVTFAAHDQRAMLMQEACRDNGSQLCDAKETYMEYHREVMTKLAEIQGEVRGINK